MQPLVTIGITSYKRIKELERCLLSITTKYKDSIEILVSEDHSPLSSEIKSLVERVSESREYCIRFETNEKNLGYDMNLGSIISKSQGRYVFFMSDDDVVCDGFIDNLIEFLNEHDCYGVLYAPFIYSWNDKKDRWHGKSFAIEAGEKSASKYIYDSILFSGLIFRKEYVKSYDSSLFKNYNYFQVYMFLKTIYRYGGYYFGTPSVMCIMDGENAYGLSESSGGNDILANRKSALSILEFNKTLFKTIKKFDQEESTNVFRDFSRQYSIHAYSPMSLAREEGLDIFKKYWNTLNTLDINLYPITKIYYIVLRVFGKNRSDRLMKYFIRIVKKE